MNTKTKEVRIKQNILSLLAISILLLVLIACSEKKSLNNEISFWHFQSEPKNKQALKKIIAIFEKENNCTVNLVELSWSDGKTKLIAAFNSRKAPDVMELGSDWIAQFSSSNVLEDISKDVNINQFIRASQEPCFWKNNVYALPWYVDTRLIFINKGLIPKDESISNIKTWQDILRISQKVQAYEGYGFGVNGPDPHRLYKKVMPIIWSNNSDIIDNGNISFANPKTVEAVAYYKSLINCGILETQKNLDNLFLQGKIAFLFSGGWLLDKLKKQNRIDFELLNIPNFKNNIGKSFIGGEYIALSKGVKNRDLAVKFLTFLTNGKTTLDYCKNDIGTVLPADTGYYKNDYFISKPYMNKFITQIENSKITPVHPKWLEIEEIFENTIEEILYEKYDVKKALEIGEQKAKLVTKR